MNGKNLPTSLIVVAVLFILMGIIAVFEVIDSLMNNVVPINFGLLGLFIGPDLLRRSRGWRICALILTWIPLVLLPLIGLVILVFDVPLNISVLGQDYGQAPRAVGVVVAMMVFALVFWVYRVLTRPDIRRLFGVDAAGDMEEDSDP